MYQYSVAQVRVAYTALIDFNPQLKVQRNSNKSTMNDDELDQYREMLTLSRSDNSSFDQLNSQLTIVDSQIHKHTDLNNQFQSQSHSSRNDNNTNARLENEIAIREIEMEDKKPEYYKLRNEINLMVLNYLISEGYENATRDFATELGLDFVVHEMDSQKTVDFGLQAGVQNSDNDDEVMDVGGKEMEKMSGSDLMSIDDGNSNGNSEIGFGDDNDEEDDSGDYDELDFDIEKYFEPESIDKNIELNYKSILDENNDDGSGKDKENGKVTKKSGTLSDLEERGISLEKYKKLTEGLSNIKIRNQIKLLILKGEIESATEIIMDSFPMLLVNNDLVYFRLLHLHLVEMIRRNIEQKTTKGSNPDQEREFLNGVLKFINDKLSTLAILQNKRFVKELELTMALLCFGNQLTENPKKIPLRLKKLLDLKLRNKVANLVNKAIIVLTTRTSGTESTNLTSFKRKEGDEVEWLNRKATDFMLARKKPESAYSHRTTEGIGMVPFSMIKW
ncbi:unnamed protein product [Ambrosiozyma monospora]|uniref:Unnamed protein product n=1 Tax=Ambrosiozyma monospora TaxID=43982 RepID=A0A9W6Z2K2_AMBMO|nr:unnamed protein product [Ambrosiozyma monospora]